MASERVRRYKIIGQKRSDQGLCVEWLTGIDSHHQLGRLWTKGTRAA